MRALHLTDAVTTCDCCGKSDLKRTVAMLTDAGDLVHYGTVCASRNSGKAPAVINREVREEHERRVAAARDEWARHPANRAERDRFAERDRLPTRLPGVQAAAFVFEAGKAADAACRAICERHGIWPAYWDVRNAWPLPL